MWSYLWYFCVMSLPKINFQLDEEEAAMLEKLRAQMAKTQGKVTSVAVIRYALRIAAKKAA